MEKALKKAAQIKLVIFDVDGVLTDGRLYFCDDGMEIKVFHVHDGVGINALQKAGIVVAIISGRPSPAVEARAKALNIQHVYLNQKDKLIPFYDLIEKLKIPPEQVAYMGDDLPDLPVMQKVGLSVAVANAHPIVRKQALWQTKAMGGYGAAREICDLILAAQDALQPIYD